MKRKRSPGLGPGGETATAVQPIPLKKSSNKANGSITSPGIIEAARLIYSADVIVFLCGAGMSADSGLPVYKNYDCSTFLKTLDAGMFVEAKPKDIDYWFLCSLHGMEREPAVFWAFWKYVHDQYKNTKSHQGYRILAKWLKSLKSRLRNRKELVEEVRKLQPFYCFTSNIDGHLLRLFKKNEVRECHGSIYEFQCKMLCEDKRFTATFDDFEVLDFQTAQPKCPLCNKTGNARPSVCLYNDRDWLDDEKQKQQYTRWKSNLVRVLKKAKFDENSSTVEVVLLEVGAGRFLQRVRHETETLCKNLGKIPGIATRIIRINKDAEDLVARDESLDPLILNLNATALNAFKSIDQEISKLKRQR